MADRPWDNVLANVLASYGQDYQSPALAGDSEVYDTSNVLGRMPQRNATTEGMRSLAEVLQQASRPDNILAGGLNSAANWLDQRPEVGKDTASPLGVAAMGSVAPMAAGSMGPRTLDALMLHLRSIKKQEGGWPRVSGYGAAAAFPSIVEAGFAPLQGAAAPWMLGAAGATSAGAAYAFLAPHIRMMLAKRDYLRRLDERALRPGTGSGYYDELIRESGLANQMAKDE